MEDFMKKNQINKSSVNVAKTNYAIYTNCTVDFMVSINNVPILNTKKT